MNFWELISKGISICGVFLLFYIVLTLIKNYIFNDF